MLTSPKMKLVEELVATWTKEELIWLNGYLSGMNANGATVAAPVATAAPVNTKITIAYGTETGNAKKLATEFGARAKKAGIVSKVVNLDQYRLNDLSKEEHFFVVCSTQGEGDPPAGAKKFWDHIHQNGKQYDKLKYSVLALGDSSYPQFCKAGEVIDEQLAKLGGTRVSAIQKCDVDYEAEANEWFNGVLQSLAKNAAPAAAPAQVSVKPSSGKKIYSGTILTNIILNDTGSAKETHHIEVAADDVVYAPGDAMGVIPENPRHAVAAILEQAGINEHQVFTYRNQELTAEELLQKKLNIFHLPERIVSKYSALIGQEIPATRICLLDLLKIYPLPSPVQFAELVTILEPIAPRLYSIASSPEAHSGEVHLTVARDGFQVNEEQRWGLCSDYLAQLQTGGSLEFYIHKNNLFRLPAPDADVIMIGPGTGIAPFRSFIAERDATGATGRNWLFFGDQHFVTDFLYQTELQAWLDAGSLTKLNVAFSRDQKEKVYVQHKMQQHAQEFFNWINSGAYIYVCGAKEPMSIDVEDTLLQIVAEQGHYTTEEAIAFVENLKEQGRYLKDVY